MGSLQREMCAGNISKIQYLTPMTLGTKVTGLLYTFLQDAQKGEGNGGGGDAVWAYLEVYSEFIKYLRRIMLQKFTSFKILTIFVNLSISYVWQGSEYDAAS